MEGCLIWEQFPAAQWVRRIFFAWIEKKEFPSGGKAGQSLSHTDVGRKAELLLQNYGSSILRLAWSYLHNGSDAEEILQETLIRYLQTAPVLESPAHEKAWLLRVAANLSKNRIAYNRLRTADSLEEELIAEGREDLSFVWEAVKSLPARYREVIHLYYQEGYSTQEIADILGRNSSTIRSDLRRGREQLRRVLKEAYDFDEGI